MDYADYLALAQGLRIRVDRLQARYLQRMRETARQAGLSDQYPAHHAHNAMCSYDGGHPWPGVNYSLARRILWLQEKSWEPNKIVDRLLDRKWATVRLGK